MKIKGGEKFEARLKEIADKLKGKGVLQVGFPEGGRYEDGTSIAFVAAMNEFGHGSTPPRPFFRNMIAKYSGEWPDLVGSLLTTTNYDIPETLNITGQDLQGQLKQSIVDTSSPPLSPVTIMLRGMKYNDPSLKVTGATVGEAVQRVKDGKTSYGAPTTPLVDSRVMLEHVDYIVKTQGE